MVPFAANCGRRKPESSTISSIQHPELLLATIRFAKKEENYKDREMCFRMMGSLPDKKGTAINIFNAATGQTIEASDLVSGHRLKSFDQEIIDIDRDFAQRVTQHVSAHPAGHSRSAAGKADRRSQAEGCDSANLPSSQRRADKAI